VGGFAGCRRTEDVLLIETDVRAAPNDPVLYAELLDNIAESIGIVDNAGVVLYFNKISEAYGGVPLVEARGKMMWETFPFLNAPHYKSAFETAVREQKPQGVEMYVEPAERWFEVRFVPSGETVAIFSADITERKLHSDALREAEAKYRALINSVDQGFCVIEMIWDSAGNATDYRFLEINPLFERMTGLQDAVGRTVRELVPGLESFWFERYGQVARSGEAARFQHGSVPMKRMFDVFALSLGGDRVGILFTDITERERQAQENQALTVRLRRAMQETHHRVKNNLQVIASLVEMQVDGMSESAAAPLGRIKHHVQALSVIHDLLTQQVRENRHVEQPFLGSRDVLETLLPLLQNTIGSQRLKADIEDIPLPAHKASALALLVSECVSNAVKHTKGMIDITLKQEDARTARLAICDDGDGFPPDFDPHRAANMGLQLIESTARWDLGGSVHYDNHSDGGGRVTVVFSTEAPAFPLEKN
jgi:PAS domain S-box-containing protein